MANHTATKSTKDKSAALTNGRTADHARPHAVDGIESEMLSLQSTIGNQAVGRLLQTSNHSNGNGIPPIVQDVLRSPGQPLDSSVRASMESKFGYDFGQVRIHADTRAAESTHAINANAYTVGKNIVFDSGRYSPKTTSGQQLLAHELAHVVQQSHSSGLYANIISQPNDIPEVTAKQAASSVISGHSVQVSPISSAPTIQRDDPPRSRQRQIPRITASWINQNEFRVMASGVTIERVRVTGSDNPEEAIRVLANIYQMVEGGSFDVSIGFIAQPNVSIQSVPFTHNIGAINRLGITGIRITYQPLALPMEGLQVDASGVITRNSDVRRNVELELPLDPVLDETRVVPVLRPRRRRTPSRPQTRRAQARTRQDIENELREIEQRIAHLDLPQEELNLLFELRNQLSDELLRHEISEIETTVGSTSLPQEEVEALAARRQQLSEQLPEVRQRTSEEEEAALSVTSFPSNAEAFANGIIESLGELEPEVIQDIIENLVVGAGALSVSGALTAGTPLLIGAIVQTYEDIEGIIELIGNIDEVVEMGREVLAIFFTEGNEEITREFGRLVGEGFKDDLREFAGLNALEATWELAKILGPIAVGIAITILTGGGGAVSLGGRVGAKIASIVRRLIDKLNDLPGGGRLIRRLRELSERRRRGRQESRSEAEPREDAPQDGGSEAEVREEAPQEGRIEEGGSTREDIFDVMEEEIRRPDVNQEAINRGRIEGAAPTELSSQQLIQRFRSRLLDIERHHSFFRYLLRAISKARGTRGIPRHGRVTRLSQSQHNALHELFDMAHPSLRRRLGASDEIAQAIQRGEITPGEIADLLVDFYRNVSQQSPDLLPGNTLSEIERVIQSIRRRGNI